LKKEIPMNSKVVVLALFLSSMAFFCLSCGPNGSTSQQQQYGIMIKTAECRGDWQALPDRRCLNGPWSPMPHIPISGGNPQDKHDPFGTDLAHGSVTHFGFHFYGDPNVYTDKDGNQLMCDARSPASWDFYYLEPYDCGPKYFYGYAPLDGAQWREYQVLGYDMENYYEAKDPGTFTALCPVYGALPAASTRFAILGSLPSTLTLTSEPPLTTNYGMPLLYVYDKTGIATTTATATSVDVSGMQATFPFPSTLSQNAYSLALVNQTNSGVGFSPAGTNLLSIASSQTVGGSPFGVAAQAVSTNWYQADNDDPYNDGTCAGQWVFDSGSYTDSSPVVTQFSLNSVKNGGATIFVGPNPTAIALYDS
jgi:hypothetical protein